MKCKDFIFGAVVSFVVCVIISLILSYLKFYDSAILLVGAFVVCILSLTLLILTFIKNNEALANIKSYEEDLHREHDYLKNVSAAFDRTIATHNAGYDRFAKSFFTDMEMYFVLRNYAMIWVYRSSMGKIRNGKSEKAREQIDEAEKMLKVIVDDPLSAKGEINIELNQLIITYKHMLDHKEKQTDLPLRLYHLNCGHDLVCKHCDDQVRRGDFNYRR